MVYATIVSMFIRVTEPKGITINQPTILFMSSPLTKE